MDTNEPKARDGDRTITSFYIEGGAFVLVAQPEPTMQPVPGYERCQRPVVGANLRKGQLVEYRDGKVYPIGHSDRPLPPAVKPAWVAPGSSLVWWVLGCFCVGIPLAIWVISAYLVWTGA